MNDLVLLKNDVAVCDSLEVAEKFNKNHNHVMRNIDNLIDQNWIVKNMFYVSRYIADNGQEYRRYYMNRDGFSLLVMGFTGKKALEWKLKYIEAFNQMEKIIKEKSTKEWLSIRHQGKLTRKAETDVLKHLVEYAKEQGSEHPDKYYMLYTKLANRTAGVEKRDEASISQLNNL